MRKGFTLIELLIVVAIIAILALIAVPNFLEAQTRSKVSRVKSDLRTYALGVEAYRVDNTRYPIWLYPGAPEPRWHYDAMLALIPLSTPIAYITTSELVDPFHSAGLALEGWTPEYADHYIYAYYKWTGPGGTKGFPTKTFGDFWKDVPNLDVCCVWSLGPFPYLKFSTIHAVPEWALALYVNGYEDQAYNQIYDPTNGTVSWGGIIRYMGDTRGFALEY